ncbi:MAG: transcription antitermination factor NusB [Legionellaceae bacterium]|nr:transcription antitermination factor NusB [Legionellaceae bacterium]
MDKEQIRSRRRSRRLALQALYQWQLSGLEASEIEAQFRVTNNMERVDVPYFSDLFQGIIQQKKTVDELFEPYLDRELSALNPVELAIIRLGTYELAYCPELPWRVVLDEAINIGREYGSTDGHKYVNGILNQVAQRLRTVEIKAENS